VIGAAEAVTAHEAWSLATAGAAYGAFEDRTRGRIAPGYLADLVVLSADPFDLAALGPDAVDGTVVGGRPVHVTDGPFQRRGRMTQRKPRCDIADSTCCAWRAAGRYRSQ